MIQIRTSNQRGHFDHGWLDTYHTFSFGDYYDPQQMGYRSLRVLNEDRVHPGKGFPRHPHRDMEIVTYLLAGELEHRDSLGTGSVIRPGEVQRMTAGSGILHSEYNPSATEPVHLLQIWILPDSKGLTPSYEQRRFEPTRGWQLLAARDGRNEAVRIHQDVDLYRAQLAAGESLRYEPRPDRHLWLQVAEGSVTLNGSTLVAGDGAAIREEPSLEFVANTPSELLLFDLA